MKCPFRVNRPEYAGGEECDPDCALLVLDREKTVTKSIDGFLHVIGTDRHYRCGLVGKDAKNTIVVEERHRPRSIL